MYFQQISTSVIDDESLPWLPFTPYSEGVQLKVFRVDPVRGEMILLLRAPAGLNLPRHHHSGALIVFTVSGRWKYREHDWIAGPGSVVFETAAAIHTPEALGHAGETLTFNVIAGDLSFLDEHGQVLAVENWKTVMQRYLAYCAHAGVEPMDISACH
ncbi:2,4'-dihydroxyacetophenone dioxygenase family protein [Paucibacter sediminis]|uniref:2,4'-dihydroxyacetophenone dioxygenase family protein n=1 Tax=Paucibacter sediminis TaxID=3019553 RepID=A0AA95NFW7_9BURK|nr:2,4'-dihydroxyacetophenone dioxygenase family protein [Paucibacter sp. S2-9]WIT11579.1 2,4'-dihydroxyacetophenone dioxygenase family protein [Paucibacter sp. S2-9]